MFTGHLTKHPNVCNSPLITKQPDSPVAAAQPDEPIVPLCFWSELREADCQGTARHFSASVAANLQIAPCRPKLMEGQFGGSKGLNGRPCAPLTSWVWIHFLTFAACYPLLTSTFIISPLFYHVPLFAVPPPKKPSPSTPTRLHWKNIIMSFMFVHSISYQGFFCCCFWVSAVELFQFLLLQKYNFVHLSIFK